MRIGIRITLLVIVIAGGVWLWRLLLPGDETLIRRQLHDLVEAASFPANEAPIAKLSNAGRVAAFFTADVELELAPGDGTRQTIHGRDELRQLAVAARNSLMSLAIAAENVAFTQKPVDAAATVRLAVVVTKDGDPERHTQEMELELRKLEGEWLIRRGRTIEYLKR